MTTEPGSYKIQLIEDGRKWNEALGNFEDANIYQIWNYARIVQDEKQIQHLGIYKKDELIALVQVRIKTVPLLKYGVAYIFSGPVWRKKHKENTPEEFFNIVSTLRSEYILNKKLVLRIRPYIFSDENINLSLDLNSFNELNFYRLQKEYNSLLLSLNDSLDVINKNLKPRWRNYLSQSLKNGLQIIDGNNSDLFNTFIQIYNQMMDRKNFREYVSPEKLMKFNDTLDTEMKLKIFIAYKDNVPIAGLVGTAMGSTGIYLLGATNDQGLELRGSYLLHWEMIKWMKLMGCTRYDLGGINKDRNPGGYKFKSGISRIEISDIGIYEASGSYLSKFLLTMGEKIYKKQ